MSLDDSPEQRLAALGLSLPASPPPPIGNFCNARRFGELLYVSGQGPIDSGGELCVGRVGEDISVEQAREHAQLVGLNILAAIRSEVGELRRVQRIIRVFGMVNARAPFGEHPRVIDGCSELLVAVFGERGAHSRCAVGMASLPNGITVEIETVVQVG